MVALDALDSGNAPEVWCVFTTREAEWNAKRFENAMRAVLRAVRRRWPDAEYGAIVEGSTGLGPRSGGVRRPHFNVWFKNVPLADRDRLEAVAVSVWCSRIDAEPWAQFVGEIAELGGLMRYLALHFLKESQRPPAGWSLKRVRYSKGYFARPRWQVRRDAENALRLKREIWKAEQAGEEGADALVTAHAAMVDAASTTWELVELTVNVNTGEIERVARPDGRELQTLRARQYRHEHRYKVTKEALTALAEGPDGSCPYYGPETGGGQGDRPIPPPASDGGTLVGALFDSG